MRPGWAWLALGTAVAAMAAITDDWKGVVAFCIASAFIPESDLWGRNRGE